ncbi:DUF4382 domain-containing protein [Terrimonas pollutisoli]|uniref:DUF4382 domain-containing protein n=1 Tax=Terrimonas pollutisoli TaxID=3034147 RepID=UPI0023ECCBBE|nr:DUF4382 domain-containing protein [Terrimonas sp. H1YJ31]
MKKLFFLTTFLTAIISLVFFSACTKNDTKTDGKAKLAVYLTDDPGDYDEVNVDIQDVQINLTTDSEGGWQSLPGVAKGVYNLLDLVDNKDTLLVNADIPAGKIQQIRLVLGNDNTIVVDGVESSLETPSAQQSGLKLNIHQDVEAGLVYKMILDFDASRSIVHTGSNKYILKPVIRTSLESVGGGLRGVVVPYDSLTNILAIQGTDTIAGTYTGATGGYWIGGLAAGSYSLHFLPSASFADTVRNDIMVTNGSVTVVDTMFLK